MRLDVAVSLGAEQGVKQVGFREGCQLECRLETYLLEGQRHGQESCVQVQDVSGSQA